MCGCLLQLCFCRPLCSVGAIFGMCENPHEKRVKQRQDSIERSHLCFMLCSSTGLNSLTKANGQMADVRGSRNMHFVSIFCDVAMPNLLFDRFESMLMGF